MKNLKHKRLLIAISGLALLVIIALYSWVGAFVLQVFPREDTKDPARVSSTDEYTPQLNSIPDYGTLGEVDEKPLTEPQSANSAAANAPGNAADHLQDNAQKTNPGKRRGLLQILFNN